MSTGAAPVDAVVFDLDGTLVDTMRSAPQAYVDTIRAMGGPVVEPADAIATWQIGATPTVIAHFLGRPVTPADMACYYEHAEPATGEARPFPGAGQLLDLLRGDGYQVAVYTSAGQRVAAGVLATYFPVVVCGDQVREPKPAAEGLVRVCEHLGSRPAGTV